MFLYFRNEINKRVLQQQSSRLLTDMDERIQKFAPNGYITLHHALKIIIKLTTKSDDEERISHIADAPQDVVTPFELIRPYGVGSLEVEGDEKVQTGNLFTFYAPNAKLPDLISGLLYETFIRFMQNYSHKKFFTLKPEKRRESIKTDYRWCKKTILPKELAQEIERQGATDLKDYYESYKSYELDDTIIDNLHDFLYASSILERIILSQYLSDIKIKKYVPNSTIERQCEEEQLLLSSLIKTSHNFFSVPSYGGVCFAPTDTTDADGKKDFDLYLIYINKAEFEKILSEKIGECIEHYTGQETNYLDMVDKNLYDNDLLDLIIKRDTFTEKFPLFHAATKMVRDGGSTSALERSNCNKKNYFIEEVQADLNSQHPNLDVSKNDATGVYSTAQHRDNIEKKKRLTTPTP